MHIAKHFPQFGIQPFILTVNDDKFSHRDESLLNEVNHIPTLRTKAFEPFDLYRTFIGKSKDEPLVASETISKDNKSLSHKISVWIRMNLFVPDARVGWFFSAVKEGKDFIIKNDIKAIITIGPPHSAHLIGKHFSRKLNIPHNPVFIDPWTDIIYYKDFNRNKTVAAVDNYLEKSVLKNAASAVFVTETMKDDYVKKYPQIKDKSHILYWGFNEDAFQSKEFYKENNEGKIILHAGNIFDYQNPPNFWKQVKQEIDKGNKLKLRFIGTVSPKIKNEIEKNGLSLHTEFLGFVPYDEMISHLILADYLLVCATEPRHVPGKLFEYLRAGNPIIAFGNDNKEVKEILEKANAGMMFNYDETGKEFFKNTSTFKTDKNFISQFSRKNIAGKLAEIIS